ncbi:toll/interleukin-1 receptor domain-containing protein [Azospirillum brasilense]|uniref:toll/interleukin-1 receptor domain-containing protein n=1 Tax=Azospirillum brasilense TaxID=192 RepID=UPI001EDACBA9|nr:toll/interleukin-1 receptor domain-containing protein [Azospirillum brasilense]UKJ76866.1 toll/interleukin-1 receptor domain-containing protein [Azospirillum brasilense]
MDALDRPVAHLFGHAFLADRLEAPGRNVLWFVGGLRDGRTILPLGLDARMAVRHVIRSSDELDDGYLRACAQRRRRENPGVPVFTAVADSMQSEYFGFNDLEPILAPALLPGRGTEPTPGALTAALSMRLQSPYRVPDGSDLLSRLIQHATTLAQRRQVFISYRWREATPFVARLARRLDVAGYACWWDRWSMSRAVAEGQTKSPPPALRGVLAHAIARCVGGITVRTDGYDRGAWTSLERECMLDAQRSRAMAVVDLPSSADGVLPSAVARCRDLATADALIERTVDELRARVPV